MRRFWRILGYLWAAPTTAVGLLFVLPALCSGGRVRVHTGVLEIEGGIVAWLLRHATLLEGGALALTLGHVVLGVDREAHERTRAHERVHVRQVERWGPLFLPAYLVAGAWQRIVRRRDAYWDNPFEKEAYAAERVGRGRRARRG